MGQSYAMAASTMGTLSTVPVEGENEFTLHVFPEESKIVQCFPTTIMLAWESRSEVGSSSSSPNMELEIK